MLSIASTRSVRALLVGALALAVAFAVPGAAQANGGWHSKHRDKHELSVMTRNLYLGSSLEPALTATTPAEFVGGVAQIYGTVLFTDFPKRAQALANEVKVARPDLVGLQEVSRWTVTPYGNPSATAPSFDFLALLQSALASKGLHYEVASVSDNANIGPAPLYAPSYGCEDASSTPPDCVVSLQDRDVILVNADTPHLHWYNAKSGQYVTQQVIPSPVGDLSFDRGWASIDVAYQGQKLRFVDTHLETEDFPSVQEAQAAEFLAGPARSRGTVLAVGDFNSAADGSQTTSYQQLTHRFTDAWTVAGHGPGLTCCQDGTLTNPVSQLATRIDLVLYRGSLHARRAQVLGSHPFEGTPPLWASDHAGVAATLTLGCHDRHRAVVQRH